MRHLVDCCFLGYNATVFAYGQTGSGKSYTMGSNVDIESSSLVDVGIIPRVIEDVFERISQQEAEGNFRFSLKVKLVVCVWYACVFLKI